MSTKDHLMAAGFDQTLADQHGPTLDAVDPAIRAKLLDILRSLGAKAIPALLVALPFIVAGDWPGALKAVLAFLLPTA